MNIYTEDNNVIITGVKDFKLSQTLECGQCFHFAKLQDEEYLISARQRLLHISQKEDTLTFYNTGLEDYDNIWRKYFDLDRDYAEIKEKLLAKDGALKPAIDAMWGVRILNQEFFETLISFIISQNQQIVRIKQIVAAISYNCGHRLGENADTKDGVLPGTYYAFPDAKDILDAGVERIYECKAGFRSPYIIDACTRYSDGTINEAELLGADYEACIDKLKQIKGVGDKVANCVALFSLGKRNAFPVDVWIKRIMESLYFDKDTPVTVIRQFASDRYGEYGGYAQQYLFYFGKINEIGKKSRK